MCMHVCIIRSILGQVFLVIFHCCVGELTASTLHGDSTADQKLLNLAKASYHIPIVFAITRRRKCVGVLLLGVM